MSKFSPHHASQKRILIIKHGALGDIILSMDGFASVREHHQDDHLAVLTTPAFAGFLRQAPYFDEVLTDQRAPVWNIRQVGAIRRLLRQNWTRIYDFQYSGRTARYFRYIIKGTGAEFVGVAPGAHYGLPADLRDRRAISERDRVLALAAAGGCPRVVADLTWLGAGREVPPDVDSAAVLVAGCSLAKPLAKRWPVEHFSTLARLLHDQGLKPMLVGTAIDAPVAEAIMAKAPVCQNLVGKTDLGDLAALYQRAKVVIGNDTGPVFLAAKLGAPTLALMGHATNPQKSAPVGDQARWLRKEAISDITPAEVMESVRTLIGLE